jgi:hypothetical protein
MTGDPSDLDPQQLWQSQQKEYDPVSLAEIHAKARAFDGKIQRRNAIEYVACGAVIVGFAQALLHGQNWLIRAGAAWFMLAAVFVAWQLHRRGSTDSASPSGETLVDGYRRQLIRQRDAIRTVGVWYIGPMIPGFLLMMPGFWLQAPRHGQTLAQHHAALLVTYAIVVLLIVGIWLLNLHGAKRLQKRIDEL